MENKYEQLIDRFNQIFKQEISCEYPDLVIQNIITILNKAGLKDMLNPPKPKPVASVGNIRGDNESLDTYSSNSGNTTTKTKRLTGLNLFRREYLQSRPKDNVSLLIEWRDMPKDEKDQYARRAKEINQRNAGAAGK